MSKHAKFDWNRVAVGKSGDCWPWTGSINTWGYGSCQLDGKIMNASRAAFISTHGYHPEGLVVCHTCDNPACCNPSHLWADTQANNLADCRRKGRASGTFPAGAKHPRLTAKLTPEMVSEARRLYATGVAQTEIARLFGVHSSSISRAVRGERWAQVE